MEVRMFSLRLLEEGGEVAGLGNYVWVALIIFFLMVFLGWLVSSKGWLEKEVEPVHAESSHGDHGSDTSHSSAKVIDDLTSLEGIGPKVAKVLDGIGITTFEALASADYGAVKAALDHAGYQYMDPAGWIEQAVLAARGDVAGLEKLKDSLKGGRK